MSRDAHHTSLHLHSSHHADLFEEFCRPPSSSPSSGSTNPPSSHPHNQPNSNLTLPHLHANPIPSNSATDPHNNPNANNTGMVSLPGHFLPYEEIPLAPELMPLNPEDEDGVVPDMHAAFGILRALGPGAHGGGHVADGLGGHGGSGQGQQGHGQGEESRAGVQRGEGVWRDLGMEGVLDGGGAGGGNGNAGANADGGLVGGSLGGAVQLPGRQRGGERRGGLRREGLRRGAVMLR